MRNFRAKTKTPESQVKREILDALKWLPNCTIFPISTTGIFDPTTKRFRKSTMRIGTPDIICCIDSHFLAIEVKSKSGRLSPAQSQVIEDISRCGGFALVARSAADVIDFLKKNALLV